MKSLSLPLAGLFLASVFEVSTAAGWDDDVPFEVMAIPRTSCLHIGRIPTMDEDILYGNRPVLQDAVSVNITDLHGQCDHDPVAEEGIDHYRYRLCRYIFGGLEDREAHKNKTVKGDIDGLQN